MLSVGGISCSFGSGRGLVGKNIIQILLSEDDEDVRVINNPSIRGPSSIVIVKKKA